jgi:hypothetical protein
MSLLNGISGPVNKITASMLGTQNMAATLANSLPSPISSPLANNDIFRSLSELTNQHSNLIGKTIGATGILSAVDNVMGSAKMAHFSTRNSGVAAAMGILNNMDGIMGNPLGSQHLKASMSGIFIGNLIRSTEKIMSHTMNGSILGLDLYNKLGISSIMQDIHSLSSAARITTPNITSLMSGSLQAGKMAEYSLSAYAWSSLGEKVGLQPANIEHVQNRFLAFSGDYSEVLRSVTTRPNWVYEAPNVAVIPAEDYYISTKLLEVATKEEKNEVVYKIDQEIKESNQDALKIYLPKLHPGLNKLWEGAVYALNSDNPDKVRHFITSLRELFTHVLHMLAPDKEVEIWDQQKRFYHNGKPTRAGRFQYICRNMEGSGKEFSAFIAQDIKMTLTLIDMFQKGTHAIDDNFSSRELELIRIKAETSLRMFIGVEFDINRK